MIRDIVPNLNLFKTEILFNNKFKGNDNIVIKNKSIEVIKKTCENEYPFTNVKNMVSKV